VTTKYWAGSHALEIDQGGLKSVRRGQGAVVGLIHAAGAVVVEDHAAVNVYFVLIRRRLPGLRRSCENAQCGRPLHLFGAMDSLLKRTERHPLASELKALAECRPRNEIVVRLAEFHGAGDRRLAQGEIRVELDHWVGSFPYHLEAAQRAVWRIDPVGRRAPMAAWHA
jgi:hypothetical protein